MAGRGGADVRRSGAAALVLALLLALAAALPAGAQNQPAGPISAAGETGADADADIRIDRRLEAIFDEIDGLAQVSATVRSGVVTLRGTVAEAELALRAEELAGRVEGVVAVRNAIEETTAVSERIVPVYERLAARLAQFAGYLPLVAVAGLLFALIALAGAWVAARDWPWGRLAPNAFIAGLMRQLVRIVFVAAGALVALDILGATALLGTILGAAGIVGLAVGFAVRDTVENYIASILLSVRQPFRPNDYIRIGEEEGSVIMLTSRATILMDLDGNHIRIPNAVVFKGIIRNYTRNPERRFTVALGIDPAANLRAALDLGLATLAEQPFVLDDPAPDAWIETIGDSTVALAFTGWVDQSVTSFVHARSEAIRLVKLALEQAGYALPEPGYRVRLEGMAGPPAGTPPARPAPEPPPAAAETTQAAATGAETVISRKAAEERARSDRNDLLDERAPQEIE
ncbi:mechanosensitive ion channel [Aquibium sp. A9E412]|uniref:mechanosensitive ion channel family protein n=1 Tax=Aquibium sp. A9E412 TaxID=2976767 RepID=UPI0025B1A0F0|nr:mechanosensitive ion channel family protein [Aquibium sp. A9E412]MDN2565329.1 mechanosensitive ion channel [Aquibium sp. A9E412]